MHKNGCFASRHEIVHWINSVLDVKVTSIQQLGAGNIYCQLLDAAYPGKVPLHKVNWQAYLPIHFLHNFKVLQSSFQHLAISKHIEVEKLAKAKYQDNLEFIQWIIAALKPKITEQKGYNPVARRHSAPVYLIPSPFNHSRSSTQPSLLQPVNNENLREQNHANKLKSITYGLDRKKSLGQIRRIPERKTRPSIIEINQNSRDLFPNNEQVRPESKKKQAWGRVHTEACSFSFTDITKELIVEEDEECL